MRKRAGKGEEAHGLPDPLGPVTTRAERILDHHGKHASTSRPLEMARCLGSTSDAAVVVAVGAMGVMQVPGDEIVDMVSVRKRLVSAALPVLVSGGVPAAGVVRHATIGIGSADSKPMVVDVSVVQVVQVPVVEIVGMSLMADRRVAAAASVNMPTVIVML